MSSPPNATVPIDEQRRTLLSTTDIQLKDRSSENIDPSAVVPGEIGPANNDRSTGHRSDEQEETLVVSRKDAMYQGSLQNIPKYEKNPEEYHRDVVETSDQFASKTKNKSFFAQIAEQIDLKLLKDLAFALFAISNFLTSLGFNVPYNFANDLASDAQVVEHRRHWIIMSIGISNCFGRVIIGFLADRKVFPLLIIILFS